MKKQMLFVMAFYCLYSTAAQPVLSKVEDFSLGFKAINYLISPTGIQAGAGGASQTWDFSAHSITSDTSVFRVLHPDSTHYAASFPAADYVERHGDGSLAYMQRVNNTVQMLAFVPQGDFVIWYHEPYTILKRPMTYLDTVKDDCTRGYSVAGDTLSGPGASLTVADGWGKLMLPHRTYNNVLRIKFIQEYSDTSRVSNDVTFARTTSYVWFDSTHTAALMRIDSTTIDNTFFTDTVVTVQMLKQELPNGIFNTLAQQDVKTFYADEQLMVTGELKYGDVISATMYDITGRILKIYNQPVLQNTSRQVIDVNDLPEGCMYITRIIISRNGDVWTDALKFYK